MSDWLLQLAKAINGSPLHDLTVGWLRTVPGLPPIVQTVHILSVATVAASIVMIDLKALGWALPRQQLTEMTRRLQPWLWTALPLLALSGAVFVVARPRRYFINPVFGIKLALLALALLASVVVLRTSRKSAPGATLKIAAAVSLFAWLGVVLAGRWIAYSDYLFPPE
jgi:hypothetical protein